MADSLIARVREWFFDSEKVAHAMDKAERRVLSKFGAYVRRTAKGGIRKAKKPAQPGRPPHSHQGALRNLLFFAFDARTRSVVDGPTPFKTAVGIVPPTLEEGGFATKIRKVSAGGRGARSVSQAKAAARLIREGRIVPKSVRTVTSRVAIAARPFMAPALAKEKPKFAPMLRDMLRK